MARYPSHCHCRLLLADTPAVGGDGPAACALCVAWRAWPSPRLGSPAVACMCGSIWCLGARRAATRARVLGPHVLHVPCTAHAPSSCSTRVPGEPPHHHHAHTSRRPRPPLPPMPRPHPSYAHARAHTLHLQRQRQPSPWKMTGGWGAVPCGWGVRACQVAMRLRPAGMHAWGRASARARCYCMRAVCVAGGWRNRVGGGQGVARGMRPMRPMMSSCHLTHKPFV